MTVPAEAPSHRRTPHLVLASGSPRRRELLQRAGYEFEVISPVVAEVATKWLTIRETTIGNAARKALAVAEQVPETVVLGADTLVALDGQVIGKPTDLADATRILRRLSDRVHEVWTSVFVCHFAAKQARGFQELSTVRFRKLDDDSIARYPNESESARQSWGLRSARARHGDHRADRRFVHECCWFTDGDDEAGPGGIWNYRANLYGVML